MRSALFERDVTVAGVLSSCRLFKTNEMGLQVSCGLDLEMSVKNGRGELYPQPWKSFIFNFFLWRTYAE